MVHLRFPRLRLLVWIKFEPLQRQLRAPQKPTCVQRCPRIRFRVTETAAPEEFEQCVNDFTRALEARKMPQPNPLSALL